MRNGTLKEIKVWNRSIKIIQSLDFQRLWALGLQLSWISDYYNHCNDCLCDDDDDDGDDDDDDDAVVHEL